VTRFWLSARSTSSRATPLGLVEKRDGNLFEKMRVAEEAVREGRTIPDPDEDTAYFLAAFGAGRSASS
jgi:hypothetical protein